MRKYDTGLAMKQILSKLNEDACSVYPHLRRPAFTTTKQVRECAYPHAHGTTPLLVKWTAQLEDFSKRFTYSDDVIPGHQLDIQAVEKFAATQVRLPAGRPQSQAVFKVLQKARQIVKTILRDYDLDEHLKLCYFGSRAAKGVPLRTSYLDERLKHLSGSSEHLYWFKTQCLDKDHLLSEACSCGEVKTPHLAQVATLTLSPVPKKWNSRRIIMPNTVVGNYWSNGLGSLIQCRLAEAGLDIRRLQEVHKMLACRYSRRRSHVTADLSAASDSFTWWLVRMLVPARWFRELNMGRIKLAHYEARHGTPRLITMQSFMTMGIGFTFPLQTLLFYSLVRAIGHLLHQDGVYSVYGDDLIYPRAIHSHVKFLFDRIGFKLNEDKTHVTTSFRESCGGDYFDGVDVRPCIPDGQQQRTGWRGYIAFLYKIANGLLRRWKPRDIGRTLHFLLTEIAVAGQRVYQIPPSFPDYAGLKVMIPVVDQHIFFSRVRFHNDRNSCRFKHLALCSEDRHVPVQTAYYWQSLTGIATRDEEVPEGKNLYASERDILRWVRAPSGLQPKNYRSSVGKRIKLKIPVLDSRQAQQYRVEWTKQLSWVLGEDYSSYPPGR